MTPKENIINWFEIAVSDLDRAKKFYENVFDIEMTTMDMNGMNMAFFPMESNSSNTGGGLVKHEMYKPSTDGAVIYLNGNPDLSVPLSHVESSGGQVVMPKTLITDEIGYMAFFKDTEGNKVALHSQK